MLLSSGFINSLEVTATGNGRPTKWPKRIYTCMLLANKACARKTPALISFYPNKQYDVFSSQTGRKKTANNSPYLTNLRGGATHHFRKAWVGNTLKPVACEDLQQAKTYCTLQCLWRLKGLKLCRMISKPHVARILTNFVAFRAAVCSYPLGMAGIGRHWWRLPRRRQPPSLDLFGNMLLFHLW